MHEPAAPHPRPHPGPPPAAPNGWAAPAPQAPAAAPAGAAPAGEPSAPGADEPPTGHPGVDAQLDRLAQADQLDVAEHLPLYEDVHRALRDTLTELDRPPGPPPPAAPAAPTPPPTPRS